MRRGALARLAWSLSLGVLAAAVSWWWAGAVWALLIGLAVDGAVFVLAGWAAMWPADADATAAHARRDEFNPLVEELVIVGMSVTGIAATMVLGLIGSGTQQVWAALLALVGVLLQWASLHLMYVARYAYEYYDGDPGPDYQRRGGIDFSGTPNPRYQDFFYFSYTLAISYAVSDTTVSNPRIRAVVMRHTLLSWLFSLIILATTVNVVTGVIMGG
jgi:uncharacterized membrane protein